MAKKKKKRSDSDNTMLMMSLGVGVVLLLTIAIGAVVLIGTDATTSESVAFVPTPVPFNQFTEPFDDNQRGWQLQDNTIANGVLTLVDNQPVAVPYQPKEGFALEFTYITGETTGSDDGIGIIGIDVEDMDADEITNSVLGQLTTALPPNLYVIIQEGNVTHRIRFSTGDSLVVYEGRDGVIAMENVAFTPATRIRIDNTYDNLSVYVNDAFVLSTDKPPADGTPQTITFLSDETFDDLDTGKKVVIDDVIVR